MKIKYGNVYKYLKKESYKSLLDILRKNIEK
jgi:hypothetical protein